MCSRGHTNTTKEHEKRILESILPMDLKHLVRGGTPLYQIKQKFEDELHKASDASSLNAASEVALARQKAESRIYGFTGNIQSERIRQEIHRYNTLRDPRLRYFTVYRLLNFSHVDMS